MHLWAKVFTVYYYFLRLVLGQNFFRFSVYLGSPGLNFTLMFGLRHRLDFRKFLDQMFRFAFRPRKFEVQHLEVQDV